MSAEGEEPKDSSSEIPTYMGLHHHSENPHMAGYTLGELAHLARSTLAGQRCLSIQTLGEYYINWDYINTVYYQQQIQMIQTSLTKSNNYHIIL